MITNFKIFENIKPEIDENTIRVDGKERGWYIDFYFDNSYFARRVIFIDNKWHIEVPEWYGFAISLELINFWAKKYDRKSETYYLLDHDTKKYNL